MGYFRVALKPGKRFLNTSRVCIIDSNCTKLSVNIGLKRLNARPVRFNFVSVCLGPSDMVQLLSSRANNFLFSGYALYTPRYNMLRFLIF